MIDNTPDTSQPDEPTESEDRSGFAAICRDEVQLRAFIVKHYGAGAYEIDGRAFVENMELLFQWVKSGKVFTKEEAKRHLKAVTVKTSD